ncbi:uncharacterized protein BT62DRAFT_937834 [Guyanagaster necrorhizus]|uniref:Uncharacterized protein n=1 Tax=Guyanagaster necrorhizus TaxID=856835 RepID=A0A9P7VHB2_9AGAR|nr:uncharacterized protein BT62DRAFT_937834 [Guyanagaster necrorhizus MCA 3950]KAG7440573.1 hypothetical protein BT62DRAFT_937834 [Guyanagaster necrorhizus MCA 3950]
MKWVFSRGALHVSRPKIPQWHSSRGNAAIILAAFLASDAGSGFERVKRGGEDLSGSLGRVTISTGKKVHGSLSAWEIGGEFCSYAR